MISAVHWIVLKFSALQCNEMSNSAVQCITKQCSVVLSPEQLLVLMQLTEEVCIEEGNGKKEILYCLVVPSNIVLFAVTEYLSIIVTGAEAWWHKTCNMIEFLDRGSPPPPYVEGDVS